jgi:hypothetical protein
MIYLVEYWMNSDPIPYFANFKTKENALFYWRSILKNNKIVKAKMFINSTNGHKRLVKTFEIRT